MGRRFFAVLWPGDSHLGPLGYPFEERDADATAARLTRFVADQLRPVMPVDIVAHSLGCRVALAMAQALTQRGVPIGRVVLMAAAVDDDALSREQAYRAGAFAAERVAYLASRRDLVLGLAFPVGDYLASFLGRGYTRTALGRGGPSPPTEPPRVEGRHVGEHGIAHGDYFPSTGGQTTDKHRAAARYAGAILRGHRNVDYR